MMFTFKQKKSSVTYHPSRDSGKKKPKNEDKQKMDPVRQQGPGTRLNVPTTSNNGATVMPSCTALFATNISLNALNILKGTLTMSRSSTHVTNLNTRLITSIPGGDTALMSRIIGMGANPNATCRLDHVSACHIAAMHDNDALDLLISSGAESSRSDKHGRTPLQLAAWTGNVKQIAVLLSFPKALRKSVVEHVVLPPETMKEVTSHSVPVNNLTNIPCCRNDKSTLPGEWSDGVGHYCRHIKEILPVIQEGWTALHAASARAHYHCVQLLLAAGADATAQDQLHRTPLDIVGYAFYSGHKIDVNNFMKTVELLLKSEGKLFRYCDRSNPLDTPLHTAVELGSKAAVEQLLQGGASATAWNSRGLTALHVCVEKRNQELLQMLLHHKCSDEDPSLVTVDIRDQTGSTVLCAAVEAEWIQGVCIAIDAGASITIKANGESPMDIAARLGNIIILQNILNIAEESNIKYGHEERATALFKAISHNHQDALELLLKNGFSIEAVNSVKANVFHIATKYGRKEILEYLLGYDCDITKNLINMPDNVGSPLYYAVENNHSDCAEILISAGAQVNADCEHDRLFRTTLLHVAARKNHYKIAEMIMKHDSETVHVTSYGQDWTPLHEACDNGNREMIEVLLRYGADLAGKSNAAVPSPIELLMKYVSRPTELIQKIFDASISSHDTSNRNNSFTDRRIKVDYTVLAPPCRIVDGTKMRVIQALIDTGSTYDQQKLLNHPLVESFLFLQWRSLLSFFYCLLVLHVCFVVSLNVYALSLFKCTDRKNEYVPNIFRSSFWIYIIYLSAFFITLQDIIFIKKNGIRNLQYLETWIRFLSTTLAIILPIILAWNSESPAEWVRFYTSVTLFCAWVKIMFILSRFPEYGYYFMMYGKVTKRVIKVLISLGLLIIGFSTSFTIQFHAQSPFEGFWASLLMSMVMMSAEPGYKDTFNKDHQSASLFMLRLTFAAFLFFVSIVLMNLLVGVAVNDVNDLEVVSNIKRLEKQVEFITAFEGTACRDFVRKILPTRLYTRWFEEMKWETVIEMRSRSYDKSICSNWYHLPIPIRETIIEKAQLQKKLRDEKQDTMLYNMKLDEMYKVIVNNDSGEPTTTQRLASLETAINKVFEEINKLRTDNAYDVSLRKDGDTAIMAA